MPLRPIFLICCVALAACAERPELQNAVPDDVARAPYPELVPLAPLLAEDESRLNQQTASAFEGRVNQLKKRASDLQDRAL